MILVTAIAALSSMLVGEGPVWIEHDQSLMFVDIVDEYIYRYYTETETVEKRKLRDLGHGTTSSFVVPIEESKNELAISLGKAVTLVNWRAQDPYETVIEPEELCYVEPTPKHQFNDAKVDPSGRLWAGSLAPRSEPAEFYENEGALYKISDNLVPERMIENLTVPNGMAWSSDRKKFFFNDSPSKQIAVYDYDDESGTISNRKVLFDFASNGLFNQTPDGMTIDNEDNLWVACFGGAQVINVNTTTGELIRRIEIPSLRVTSCCFGGQNYSTLFVTTASMGLPEDEFENRPLTGRVFEVTGLQVRGLPPNEFILDKSTYHGDG